MNYDYLAGIIDGEGTVSISKDGKSFVPYIAIANNSMPLIKAISDFLSAEGMKTKSALRSPRKKLIISRIHCRLDIMMQLFFLVSCKENS